MLNDVKIKILDNKLTKLPDYLTKGSAGLDLRASINRTIEVKPNETKLISTGISIFIEDSKYAGLILPRSGLGHKHGIVLGNLVGLIDSDYQGPLMFSCWNRSDAHFTFEPYDRIAQLVFISVQQPELKQVESFEKTGRGDAGFGSSGKK